MENVRQISVRKMPLGACRNLIRRDPASAVAISRKDVCLRSKEDTACIVQVHLFSLREVENDALVAVIDSCRLTIDA